MKRHFTQREMEVLTLVGQGIKCKDIAAKLGIALQTVYHHASSARKRAGIHGQPERLSTVVGNILSSQESEVGP